MNLQRATGAAFIHAPYRGIAQALQAAIASEVQLTWASIPSALAHVKAGTLKPLAFAARKRSPALPDLPTFEELGLQGIVACTAFLDRLTHRCDIVTQATANTRKRTRARHPRA